MHYTKFNDALQLSTISKQFFIYPSPFNMTLKQHPRTDTLKVI